MNLIQKIKQSSKSREFPSIVILLVIIAINIILQPSFFSINVLNSNLLTFTPLILVSIGQAIIILGGGLDLSVGAGISLINCILATVMKDSPESILLAFLGGLVAAIVMGLINGFVTGYLRLPAMIATFATSAIWFGLALFIRPQPGGYVPYNVTSTFTFSVFIISIPLIIIVLSLLLWNYIKKRRLGRYIYAIGSNEQSAYANGINVERIKLMSYVLGFLFVYLAAISITMQTASGDAYLGSPYTLSSVAAVVIGGISLQGGRGKVYGAVIGALILNLVINVIYFANVPSIYQEFVKGMIIIVALATAIIYKTKETSRTL